MGYFLDRKPGGLHELFLIFWMPNYLKKNLSRELLTYMGNGYREIGKGEKQLARYYLLPIACFPNPTDFKF